MRGPAHGVTAAAGDDDSIVFCAVLIVRPVFFFAGGEGLGSRRVIYDTGAVATVAMYQGVVATDGRYVPGSVNMDLRTHTAMNVVERSCCRCNAFFSRGRWVWASNNVSCHASVRDECMAP